MDLNNLFTFCYVIVRNFSQLNPKTSGHRFLVWLFRIGRNSLTGAFDGAQTSVFLKPLRQPLPGNSDLLSTVQWWEYFCRDIALLIEKLKLLQDGGFWRADPGEFDASVESSASGCHGFPCCSVRRCQSQVFSFSLRWPSERRVSSPFPSFPHCKHFSSVGC